MRLDGKVTVVTGAGSGIGRAIALRFAEEGAHVVLAGRRRERLEATLAAASGPGRRLAVVTDVADSASVRGLFAEVGRQFGGLDVLVNNAGTPSVEDFGRYNRTAETRMKELGAGGPITTHWDVTQEMSDDAWRRMVGAHLDGTFYCTREALRLMAPRNRGAIINVSSTAGIVGQEAAPHYSAAKAGVLGFTRAVAREVASRGVRVNAICPGFVDTAMSDGFSPTVRRGTLARIPLGRWGEPQEVAAVALFLATDESSYFTGQCLSPNGGIFMG